MLTAHRNVICLFLVSFVESLVQTCTWKFLHFKMSRGEWLRVGISLEDWQPSVSPRTEQGNLNSLCLFKSMGRVGAGKEQQNQTTPALSLCVLERGCRSRGNRAPLYGALGRASLDLGSVTCIRSCLLSFLMMGMAASQPKRRLLFYKCQRPNALEEAAFRVLVGLLRM